MEGNKEQKAKHLTPTRAIDEIIGDEEQSKKKMKKQETGIQPSYHKPMTKMGVTHVCLNIGQK